MLYGRLKESGRGNQGHNLENPNEYRKERSEHVLYFVAPKVMKQQATHMLVRLDIAQW
jgi:hypothetical protein